METEIRNIRGREYKVTTQIDETALDFDNPLEWSEPFYLHYAHRKYILGHFEIDDIEQLQTQIGMMEEGYADLWWTLYYNDFYFRLDESGKELNINVSDGSVDIEWCCKTPKYGVFHNYSKRWSFEQLQNYLKRKGLMEECPHEERFIYAIPFYLYDHSGLSVSLGSFSCPWDSGQVGYIIATEESWEEITGEKWTDSKEQRNRLHKNIEGWFKYYNDYVMGMIFTVSVEDVETADMDSLGGIYRTDLDSDDYLDETIEDMVASLEKQREERLIPKALHV